MLPFAGNRVCTLPNIDDRGTAWHGLIDQAAAKTSAAVQGQLRDGHFGRQPLGDLEPASPDQVRSVGGRKFVLQHRKSAIPVMATIAAFALRLLCRKKPPPIRLRRSTRKKRKALENIVL
jgi:hypothetical protein